MKPESLHGLIYRSRRLENGDVDERTFEVDSILERSRINNAAHDLTGVLMTSQDHFLQVLEGPLKNVAETFETICRDMRHTEIAIIEFEPIAERRFSGWSMADVRRPGRDDFDLTGAWDILKTLIKELSEAEPDQRT